MAILTWGKPTLEVIAVADLGVDNKTWTAIPTPKEGTTVLETSEGSKTEALEEGGDVVDVIRGKNKYALKFTLYKKKGETLPSLITDTDGVVAGNLAIRLTPQDSKTEGFMLECCNVSVVTSWSSADGTLLQYTFDACKPKSGSTCKPYTKEE